MAREAIRRRATGAGHFSSQHGTEGPEDTDAEPVTARPHVPIPVAPQTILLALVLSAGAGCSPAVRKPWDHHFTIQASGGRMGYGVMYFRIEDGKAVSGFEVHRPWHKNLPGATRQPKKVVTRHIETLDGKPLSFHQEVTGHDGRVQTITYTVSGGKAKLMRTSKLGDDLSVQTATVDWPEGAVMWHGEYLQCRKQGLVEGTTYAVKRFNGWSEHPNVVRVRVGPTKAVDMGGHRVALTEIMKIQKDLSGSRPTGVMILQVDSDFVPYTMRSTWGDDETTWVMSDKAQATRRPAEDGTSN